jgi:hypothetical protein
MEMNISNRLSAQYASNPRREVDRINNRVQAQVSRESHMSSMRSPLSPWRNDKEEMARTRALPRA